MINLWIFWKLHFKDSNKVFKQILQLLNSIVCIITLRWTCLMWKLAKITQTSFFFFSGPLIFEYISFVQLVESWELCKFCELSALIIFFFSSSYINTPYKLLSYINILNTSMSLNKTHLHISYSFSHHNLLLENWAKQKKSIEIKIKIITITIAA